MNLITKLFKNKNKPIQTHEEFWNWFNKNQRRFFKVIKNKEDINEMFFNELSSQLNQLRDDIFYVAGMHNENTAELILTADGDINNMAFIEDLILSGPKLDNWKFTNLKPALNIQDANIELAGYKFNEDSLYFYIDDPGKNIEEINIVIMHKEYTSKNKSQISNGTFIFLDNYIGELELVTQADHVKVIGFDEKNTDIKPINQLKSYLQERHKKFIEKYQDLTFSTEDDQFSSFTMKNKEDFEMLAIINTSILNQVKKPAYPWVSKFKIDYNGENNNGMPDSDTYEFMDRIEDDLMTELTEEAGYINIGRTTGVNRRTVYFVCKDFFKPSRIMSQVSKKYSKYFNTSNTIYIDKYWETFDKYADKSKN